MRRGFHCTTSSYSSFNFLRAGCGVLTMSTSAHLTSRSRTVTALGAFRSSVMPRLLRLARCQGYASFACGCGGIWCPCLQRSPDGGSTLMTSAPKSDKITAALGPAMKLASSTTFNPEKILSLICFPSTHACGCACLFLLSPPKLRRSLFKEGRSPFLLVLGSGAQPEERSLQRQALVQAGFQSFGHGSERIPDGDRSVGKDLFQNPFGAADQIGGG